MFTDKMMTVVEARKGLVTLKMIVKKLQSHFQMFTNKMTREEPRRTEPSGIKFNGGLDANVLLLPEDVKEGQFAVVAISTEKPQRFIVEMRFLSNPAFMLLLEEAGEEYGLQQKGVLTVPCLPEELQKILQQKGWQDC